MTGARQWTVYGLIDPRSPRAIRYIGLTKDIRSREKVHRSEKRNNNSGLMEWKQDLRAAGVEVLAIPLETHRNLKSAQEAERYFIHDLRNQRAHGLLNIHDGGVWGNNHVMSEQTRARQRTARLGKKRSPESIAKGAASNRGKKRSPETCARIGAGNRGKKLSPEHIEKVRQANLGRKHPPRSLETLAKMSLAHQGRPKAPEHLAKLQAGYRTWCARPRTLETQAKWSEVQKLRYQREPMTTEHKAKLSAAGVGHKVTSETRTKISVALKGRPANARQREGLAKGRLPGKKYTSERLAKLQAGHKAWAAKRAEERGAE